MSMSYLLIYFTCINSGNCSFYLHKLWAGTLNAVYHLSVTKSNLTILITWEAPFTLNITNTEPDIAYCVNISAMNYFSHVDIATECNITQTEFFYTIPHKVYCHNNDFYVTVTPVNGAGQGVSEKVRFQCKYRSLNIHSLSNHFNNHNTVIYDRMYGSR